MVAGILCYIFSLAEIMIIFGFSFVTYNKYRLHTIKS